MYKSLNSKLVLIFIVFMISVMTTVGIFLMNGVFGFYTDEFSVNIDNGFAGTVTDQLTEALKYEDSALAQKQLLSAYANVFGFDRGRNFYILDKIILHFFLFFSDVFLLFLQCIRRFFHILFYPCGYICWLRHCR